MTTSQLADPTKPGANRIGFDQPRCRPAAIHLAACLTWLGGFSGDWPRERSGPDPRAVVIAAIDSMGGIGVIGGLDRWIVTGTGRENLTAEVQGLSPGIPTWRPHEERIAIGVKTPGAAWERRTPRNDRSLRWRRFVYGDTWTGVVDWNAGWGRRSEGAPNPESRRGLARRVPHLLLLEAAAPGTRLTWEGSRVENGRRHEIVAMEGTAPVPVRLVIEQPSARLTGVEYQVWVPGRGEVTVAWRWTNWRPDGTLGRIPGGHRITVGGVPFQEVRYREYGASDPGADSLLSIPTIVPPPKLPAGDSVPESGPSSGEVAPGAHVVTLGGFRVMVVEFRDFVAVVEAPEVHPGLESIPAGGTAAAGRTTIQLREALARLAPGKPVRFLIVSHHHSDHLGGIGGIADSTTTILAPVGDRAAIRAALAAVPPGSSGSAGQVAVEGVARSRVISDGARRLEVRNVGKNPHTAENLFAWLPVEGIVFQGDLFYFEGGGAFPPLGRETMNRFFADWLDRHGIEPRSIYGVHSDGAAGVEALKRVRSTLPGSRR